MSRVYVCSSCYVHDEAAVRSGEVVLLLYLHCSVCYYLHCVNGVYVCSSCCDKFAVCSGEWVPLLQAHCLLLPSLCEWGLCLFLML